MPVFVYRARDALGKLIEGELESATAGLVKEEIAKQGFTPIFVSEKPIEISFKKLLLQKRVNMKDISNLTRQFQVMFAAGTPIDRILDTLTRQARNEELRLVLTQIQRSILSGSRLSDAFKQHPKYFNNLYISMLDLGESGGILDRALGEMASIFKKEHELNSKVKSATLYPKIVLGVLGVVTWSMLVFVIPSLENFYAKYKKDLPLPTQILLYMSNLFTTYWYVPLAIVIAMYYWYRVFSKTEQGKSVLGYLAFYMPVFGRLNLLIANARFCHLIAALYRSGIPLSQALNVVSNTIENIHFSKEILVLKNGLEQGNSLSKGMEKSVYFEPMVQEACSVGEKTGQLDILLKSTAEFYDGEVEDTLKNLSVLIEPILLFFLFGAVLLLALAIYMPIWNISKVILPS